MSLRFSLVRFISFMNCSESAITAEASRSPGGFRLERCDRHFRAFAARLYQPAQRVGVSGACDPVVAAQER